MMNQYETLRNLLWAYFLLRFKTHQNARFWYFRIDEDD